MTLKEEYRNQNRWRPWDGYLDQLPISKEDTILDLGCSIGVVTEKLSMLSNQAIGIDIHKDLLDEAIQNHSNKKTEYICGDLKKIRGLDLKSVDGIWTSFAVSYFPDLRPVLKDWLSFLKPGGWIAVVEMSDLFGHYPLRQNTINIFRNYYEKQRNENLYDFEMGSRMKETMIDLGLSIIYEEDKYDPELTFNGPAEPAILRSWSARFDRMKSFREYLGDRLFQEIKNEFMECLSGEDHTCNTIVKYIIADK